MLVWRREFANTNTAEGGVSFQEWKEPVEVMLVWNGVKNEVESFRVLRPIGSIFVYENVFRTKATRILFLLRRCRHYGDVGSHLRGELNG